jgi:hypothetical protein
MECVPGGFAAQAIATFVTFPVVIEPVPVLTTQV